MKNRPVLHSSLICLFAVLFNFSRSVRVVHVVPLHRLNLLLQVLEGNKQGRHDEDLQDHTD